MSLEKKKHKSKSPPHFMRVLTTLSSPLFVLVFAPIFPFGFTQRYFQFLGTAIWGSVGGYFAGTVVLVIGTAGVIVSIDDLTATGDNRTVLNNLLNKALGEQKGDQTTNTIKVIVNGAGAITSFKGVFKNGKAVINGSDDIGGAIIDGLNAAKDTDGTIQSGTNLTKEEDEQ